MTTFRVVAGTKTLKQVAADLAAETGEANLDAAKMPEPKRKKQPRTFDRTPKGWLAPLLRLPPHSADEIYRLRHDVLSLSAVDTARLLRISRTTLSGWETGRRSAPFSAFLALRLFADQLPVATLPDEVEPPHIDGLPVRNHGSRGNAARLGERMNAFAAVYNAAWHLRASWHGPSARRAECAWKLANVIANELRRTTDYEALLYAVADSITSSPLGLPWEA